MANELVTWTRPRFTPGGGEALLFYVLYGEFELPPTISRSRHRTNGIPDGCDLMHYDEAQHPDTLNSFREGYLWDELCANQPSIANGVASSRECVILRGAFPDPPDLDYFRDAVGLITALSEETTGIFDPQGFAWHTPQRWRTHIFDPDGPVPRHHVVILSSDEARGGTWLHTRGMRKYGRPDLSIHDVPEPLAAKCVELINRFIEMMAFGALVPEGQAIRVEGLPEGMRCRHRGSMDDPAFNNVHLELEWPVA